MKKNISFVLVSLFSTLPALADVSEMRHTRLVSPETEIHQISEHRGQILKLNRSLYNMMSGSSQSGVTCFIQSVNRAGADNHTIEGGRHVYYRITNADYSRRVSRAPVFSEEPVYVHTQRFNLTAELVGDAAADTISIECSKQTPELDGREVIVEPMRVGDLKEALDHAPYFLARSLAQ